MNFPGLAKALLAGVLPFTASAATFTAGTTNRAHEMFLEWEEPLKPDSDGFELQQNRALLSSNWVATGGIDRWPSAVTNWAVSRDHPQEFFRIRHVNRGHLVDATEIQSLGPPDLAVVFEFYGLPTNLIQDSVSIYSMTYETFDPRGISTFAAGLLILPVGILNSTYPSPPETMPLLSLQHGTIIADERVPSAANISEEILAGLVFATDGYGVSMPDYIGMGAISTGMHPYLHARSEAVASVDLLRAVRLFMEAANRRKPNGQLFIAGYSQGGHATLALQRELQEHHAAEFPLTASAPMAGPHNLSGIMKPLIFSDEAYRYPAYVPYNILGLNAVYHFGTPADFFKPAYTNLPALFDGSYSSSEINALLPDIPSEMLSEAFISNATLNADDPFSAALRQNDTFRDWVPTAPTRFFHCAADDVVPYSNSVVAVETFLAAGAPAALVELVDPAPSATHAEGFVPCMLATKIWFDSLRNQ